MQICAKPGVMVRQQKFLA